MARSQIKVQHEAIEKAQKLLSELPKIEKVPAAYSGQAAVKALRNEIKEAQKRGYTIEQISDYLKGVGIAIPGPTLKNYLTRSQSKGKINTARASRADTALARPGNNPRLTTSIDAPKDVVPNPSGGKAKIAVAEDNPNI